MASALSTRRFLPAALLGMDVPLDEQLFFPGGFQLVPELADVVLVLVGQSLGSIVPDQ
jgi:hypothetical protein